MNCDYSLVQVDPDLLAPPCTAMLRYTLTLAVSCILFIPQHETTAAPPDEKPAQTAETLRQLRKPVQEWLERDIAEKTLRENRAYAGLILAFGLARAGDTDEAKKLLREAAVVLEKGDPAH